MCIRDSFRYGHTLHKRTKEGLIAWIGVGWRVWGTIVILWVLRANRGMVFVWLGLYSGGKDECVVRRVPLEFFVFFTLRVWFFFCFSRSFFYVFFSFIFGFVICLPKTLTRLHSSTWETKGFKGLVACAKCNRCTYEKVSFSCFTRGRAKFKCGGICLGSTSAKFWTLTPNT